MRCKKHSSDLSSSVGVCASCLRERLFSLIAAQAQAQQAQAQLHAAALEDRRKSDTNPPPLIFPRSVSPYISHRKTDDTAWYHHHHLHHSLSDHRFYSTPQIGPTSTSVPTASSYRKKRSKFSLIFKLFRSRSEKIDSDPRVCRDPCTTSSSSPSWFPSMLSSRRKNRSTLFPGNHVPCRTRDRGMSPERAPDDGEDCEGSSGYSSESSQGWKKTPVIAPMSSVRRGRQSHARNVSGLAFCLSPLVRASPNRHWNQKGLPPDIGFSGEVRVPAKPHLSTAAAYCANRSRKMADFGRVNLNR